MRTIGIRHRVKRTAEGEARPTQVVIKQVDSFRSYNLDDETAELDFVCGQFPTAYRTARDGEDLSAFPPHHVKKQKKNGSDEEVVKVPAEYDGLKTGDDVAMTLGGSGDRLAYALSRRGDRIGAKVFRVPPFALKEAREKTDGGKEEDAKTLALLFDSSPKLFYEVTPRERNLIKVREEYSARKYAQKNRIACEQRLRQRTIDKIFLSDNGYYLEGAVGDEYDKIAENDAAYQALRHEEKEHENELKKSVHQLDIWWQIFEPIKGCGEVIAAGIISPIGNILRFKTDAQLKKFASVHVLPDGRFNRKRRGAPNEGNPALRQALYLLGDQFNRHPDSPWGKKLREYKRIFREKHPETIAENGKKKYGNAHIHKMAIWRTLTKFIEWLYREWARIEKEKQTTG